MWEQLTEVWLPRMLFFFTLIVAAMLLAAIAAAPWLTSEWPSAPRVARLFATDTTVRRVAAASAVGLVVTAFVFFRTKGGLRAPRKVKPSRDIAGA
jgi:hypothetical protein